MNSRPLKGTFQPEEPEIAAKNLQRDHLAALVSQMPRSPQQFRHEGSAKKKRVVCEKRG
ncbi:MULTISPECIES: hypothetical protein [unclassified Shinella]|uniref:hypothetical protein n=1 Tax=unclassified Shinella TaxID=2643062 RepID=UPI00234F4036|nr:MULTISPECIES: hypothetical protein [unclassified Shinella]MCO5148483.1 hypothetical protein [Shinella sp.]MDC7264556.1 hypothetical protein [Shinella sp. HY16]MDC7271453.1 hypothetical protein [Shinella sp. YZ44]